jgi:uncharacterized protein (DUF952 family)
MLRSLGIGPPLSKRIRRLFPLRLKQPCDARFLGSSLDLRTRYRHPCFMLIYKIFRTPEWDDLKAKGATQGAPIDLADEFIHFSTAIQAEETASKHFAGVEGLWLAAVEADPLGEALKWEVSRGGAEFPHLYRVLTLEDVAWCQPLALKDGAHLFPAGLA